MSKATIQYRGTEVEVKPGQRAVLDCYKKKFLGQLVVNVEPFEDGGIIPGGELEINDNGVADVTRYATAKVNVVPKLQSKTVTPTEQAQTVNPDEDFGALSEVTVEAIQTQEKTVTVNGTVEADAGKYLKKVNVNVPVGTGISGKRVINENGTFDVMYVAEAEVNVQPPLETATVAPSREEQKIVPGEGVYGLSEVTVGAIQVETRRITENGTFSASQDKYFKAVTVDVPIPEGYIKPEGTWDSITKNGTYDVHKYEKAIVNVQPALQEKSVTPSAAAQTVTPDGDNYGLSKVNVAAVPTEEVIITEPVKEVVASAGKFISKVNVSVPTVTVYSGTSEPTNDIGADGDIYLLLEG